MKKKELLKFYRKLEGDIGSLGEGESVSLCSRTEEPYITILEVEKKDDYYLVNDYIIVPIKMVIKNVFQVLAY